MHDATLERNAVRTRVRTHARHACTHAVQVCKCACSMVGWRSVACTPRQSEELQRCSLLSPSPSRFLFFSRAGSTAAQQQATLRTRRPVPVPVPTVRHRLCHLPVPVFFCFVSSRAVLCALCGCCLASHFALLLCVASPCALLWLGFTSSSSSSSFSLRLHFARFGVDLCAPQHSTAQLQTSQRRQWRRTRPSSFTIRRGSTR